MKIALRYREDIWRARLVQTYCTVFKRELEALGHEVINVYNEEKVIGCDAYIELDNGRDQQGQISFNPNLANSLSIPTAVWFVDSHGQFADYHQRIAPAYKHVFFAVWSKRDLFRDHPSAHWCPNATDSVYFPEAIQEPLIDFGFFGSRHGLVRAQPMVEFAKVHGWVCDVRQVGKQYRHRWPATAEAMANCRVLFNHGQKHDGPNLRVVESMCVGRPLITDLNSKDGMSRLFEPNEHFLGYQAYSYDGLEDAMKYAMTHPQQMASMAKAARKLVLEKHQIKNRVEQMLEVINA